MKQFIFIDLFSGAGGVTTGIEKSVFGDFKVARVIAAVNHDDLAIQSHTLNHPDALHYVEDIRTLDLTHLKEMVSRERVANPDALICIWASAECTNFSRAKGGMPRDADSRTLPEHLYRYVEDLNPDLFFVENVEEFMCWGPLDEQGKPVSRYCGLDYMKWKDHIQSYGYEFDHRILNAADFGAYTSRKRYFGIFSKPQFQINWPTPTHSKKPDPGMFGGLQKWKPVKDVLDFSDEGRSIFTREKPLSDKTLGRIYAGLKKYVSKGETAFITKWLGNSQITGINNGNSIENPFPTLTTQNRFGLVQTSFLSEYHGTGTEHGLEKPSITLTTKDRLALISAHHFLDKQFSSGSRDQSVEVPAGTLTTVPKFNLCTVKKISPFIMDTNFNNVGCDIEKPAPVITANRKYHYLVNPQFESKGSSIDSPCFTLIARMDKAPPSIVQVEEGFPDITILETDSPIMRKIKEFMLENGIVDIKMRMLKVPEMLKIQGFPENYKLVGSQAHQKKFIGNSVPPDLVEALIEGVWAGIYGTVEKVAI